MEILTLYDITSNGSAAEYFVAQLGMGTSLSARVKTAIDFSAGRMFVALPEGTDLRNLPKLEQTGRIRWRRRGFATLASLIKHFLAVKGAGVLIQDTLASPSEEWLRDYVYRDFVAPYNEEVYWHLTNSKLREEDILGVIYSATFRPFSAFFYVQTRPDRWLDLKAAQLDEVVNNLSGVAVDVFDEESFLLWWSDRVPLPIDIKSP